MVLASLNSATGSASGMFRSATRLSADAAAPDCRARLHLASGSDNPAEATSWHACARITGNARRMGYPARIAALTCGQAGPPAGATEQITPPPLKRGANQPDAHTETRGGDLGALFRLHALLVDLLRLSVAILRHTLDPTSALRMPPLGPISPLDDTARALEEHRATREDVERWVADGSPWALMPGRQHLAPMEEVRAAFDQYPALADPLSQRLEPYLDELARRAAPEGQDAAIARLRRALRESGR